MYGILFGIILCSILLQFKNNYSLLIAKDGHKFSWNNNLHYADYKPTFLDSVRNRIKNLGRNSGTDKTFVGARPIFSK